MAALPVRKADFLVGREGEGGFVWVCCRCVCVCVTGLFLVTVSYARHWFVSKLIHLVPHILMGGGFVFVWACCRCVCFGRIVTSEHALHLDIGLFQDRSTWYSILVGRGGGGALCEGVTDVCECFDKTVTSEHALHLDIGLFQDWSTWYSILVGSRGAGGGFVWKCCRCVWVFWQDCHQWTSPTPRHWFVSGLITWYSILVGWEGGGSGGLCVRVLQMHGWEIAVILRNFRKTKLSK